VEPRPRPRLTLSSGRTGQALTRSSEPDRPGGPPTVRAAPWRVGASMKPRKPSRKDILSAASDVRPGDALDPRFDRRGDRPPGRRKTLQLCREAERTLRAVLGGECEDLLRELVVLSVVPAPNAGRLLVTVAVPASAGVSVEEATRRLLRA